MNDIWQSLKQTDIKIHPTMQKYPMIKEGSRILCIFAHREDHMIFGWPIIQNPQYERYLLTGARDGQDAVIESCNNENIRLIGTMELENGFSFRSFNPNLAETYKIAYKKIKRTIHTVNPDYIFTHNPMGEYGHYDHQFLFKLIYNEFPQQRILITDITARSSKFPGVSVIPRLFEHLYKEKIMDVIPDIDFYKRNTDLFNKYNMWSTNPELNLPKYPKLGFSLYLLPNSV